MELFEKLGLTKFYPRKLSIQDAIQIRDDILQLPKEYPIELYAFKMLQKVIAFDSQCRFKYAGQKSEENITSEDWSSSDDDESDEDDGVHPIDCLIALIHCSDNFLRQDLFSRLATCQIAVPLLLPDPITKDPTLLMWAMRAIMKECKLSDKTIYSGRIITRPNATISFVRLGRHLLSKSEIINGVMNKVDSDNKIVPFFGYTSPGGSISHVLLNGLLEVCWYLPGNDLFPEPIIFTNLRGDAYEGNFEKQINFVCEIATVHVVLVSDEMLRQEKAISMLQRFAEAPEGVIILQTSRNREFKAEIKKLVQGKISVLKSESNPTAIFEKIQKKLVKLNGDSETCIVKLSGDSETQFPEIASKCSISIDEEENECVRGNIMSNKLFEVINQYHLANPHKSPKNLLPLQSENLWHKWAALDKEQYRLRKKNDDDQARKAKNDKVLSVKDYEEEQRRMMEEKRLVQYDQTKNINELMKLLLEGLRTENKEVRRYFLMWIKMKLDDLSRKTLPTYHQRVKIKREELNKIQLERNESDEQKCKLELKNLDKQLINASFGLEHLFRELGQLYECVATNEDVSNPSCIVNDLPYIAAELMHEGFPLELLDGDASHMPKQWISAVFDNLSDIVLNKSGRAQRLYVLSVLGIQSTGKSTLLNTVFGVQFSVSAGRCTRGAFMQLIPTHPSLYSKTGVGHILLIDTEGIRAPELDKMESREHDNELATFVIGIANLTLINVAGEVAGEIDDVLNASVHAFLRMKEVKLKTSCYIIHQNLAVIGADKLLQARQKTKDKLDKMTKAAAIDTGLESKYTYFRDVIEFNHETDVSEFVSLWNGELPMARVSSGYSSRAQALKLRVIEKCGHFSKESENSISLFSKHLENLWNAIIQEDFVFTFQNTFEIVSFKNLEIKYSDIACNFTTFMGDLQKAAENELFGCEADKLKYTFEKFSKEIRQKAAEKYKECAIEMEEFIKADEVMLKWKHDMLLRLQQLHEQLSEIAFNGCHQMYQAKKERKEFDDDKEQYGKFILIEVQNLVKKLGDTSLSDGALKMKFDETWKKIMETINVKTFTTPNIPHAVEESLREFQSGANRSLLHQKLSEDIREYGLQFENMVIKDCHLKEYQERRLKNILKDAASYVTSHFIQKKQKAFEEVGHHMYETCLVIKDQLQKIRTSGRSFHATFVTDMLTTIQLRNKQFKGPNLTIEFEVDMELIACGYAMPIFEEMGEKFRRMHDTQLYIQEVMRPRFENMFINMFTKAGNEKIAAEAMCQQLRMPICDYVIENLPSIIVEKMRNSNPWMKDKQRFIAKTLYEIGEMLNNKAVHGFACCMEFVTNPGKSLEKWAKTFTERHCETLHGESGKTNLSLIALDKMNEVIDSLIKATDEVYDSYQLKSTVNCVEWLEKFHAKVTQKMKLALSDLKMYVQVTELSHLELFKTNIIEKLNQYRSEFETKFLNIRYSETEKRESAHIILFKSVAGCTHQCPFCGAQCELTINVHDDTTVKHFTQHRPEALGRYKWDANNEMVLDICSYSVTSDFAFRNVDTGGEYFPYKKYSKKYPSWDISADKSFTASLFWKWFIGNYSSEIEKEFNFSKTKVSKEWQKIKWHEVKSWIEKNYNLKLI